MNLSPDPPPNSNLGAGRDSDVQGVHGATIDQHSENGLAVCIGDVCLTNVVPAAARQAGPVDLDGVELVVLGPDAVSEIAAHLGVALLDLLDGVLDGLGELGPALYVLEFDNLVAGGVALTARLSTGDADTSIEAAGKVVAGLLDGILNGGDNSSSRHVER